MRTCSKLQAYECPTFKGTAKMNGRSLKQEEQGGTYSSLGLGKGLAPGVTRECAEAEWSLPTPLPDEPITELEVFDATGRLTFGVRNLGTRRSLNATHPVGAALGRARGAVLDSEHRRHLVDALHHPRGGGQQHVPGPQSR